MGTSTLAVAGIIQPTSTIYYSPVVRNYACPMRCEKDKVYGAISNVELHCPLCKMRLFEVNASGEMEHTDHNPKHGGDFFMASDGWHHLEATLTPQRELKLYIYDNYTKPHPGLHRASADIARLDAAGKPDKAQTIELKPSEGGAILIGELPAGLDLPVTVAAHVAFANGPDVRALFNMTYKEYSKDQPGPYARFTPENMRTHPPPAQIAEPLTFVSGLAFNTTLNVDSGLLFNSNITTGAIATIPPAQMYFIGIAGEGSSSPPAPLRPTGAVLPQKIRVTTTGAVKEDF